MSIALSLDFIFNDMILNIVFLCELYKGNKVSQEHCNGHFFQLIIHEQNNISGKNNTAQKKQLSYQSV